MAIDKDKRISRIHSTGYWRVNVRPSRFVEKLVPTLTDCWRLLESSRVVLRGWDYPHVQEREKATGNDWIQSGIDWPEYGHVEFWRFYQSGQFVHHFAGPEDYHELPWESSDGKPERYLLYTSALLRTTEIFEFASRLAAKDLMQSGGHVAISLGNMANRELAGWDHEDMLPRGYVSDIDDIKFDGTYSTESLLAKSAELGLDASLRLFERFGWFDPPREWLAERQKRLLDRHLR